MVMSELDRQIATLDTLDRDELMNTCTEQAWKIMALQRELDLAKIEIQELKKIKQEYGKIVLEGLVRVHAKENVP